MQNKNYKLLHGSIDSSQEPLPLKEILPSLIAKLKLDEKIKDYRIMQAWDDFVQTQLDSAFQKYLFAHRISKDRKLVIGVRSAVLANELQFAKIEIENNFLQFLTSDLPEIKGIIFELRG